MITFADKTIISPKVDLCLTKWNKARRFHICIERVTWHTKKAQSGHTCKFPIGLLPRALEKYQRRKEGHALTNSGRRNWKLSCFSDVENTIQNITEFIKQSNIDIFVKNNQNNHKKFEDLKNFNHEKFQEINNPRCSTITLESQIHELPLNRAAGRDAISLSPSTMLSPVWTVISVTFTTCLMFGEIPQCMETIIVETYNYLR